MSKCLDRRRPVRQGKETSGARTSGAPKKKVSVFQVANKLNGKIEHHDHHIHNANESIQRKYTEKHEMVHCSKDTP